MKNEKIVKSNSEQTHRANDDIGPTISRRQFSVGLSGTLLAGTVLEPLKRNTPNSLAAKNSNLSTQPESRRVASYVFNQPQYVLSDTAASVWSPDSQHIATFQENVVTLYNANTGKSELTYRKHTDDILVVKWSVNSKYLASSGFEHIVHVWDAMSCQAVTMYKGHTDIVRDIAWSPDQHHLASAGYDKTVQVWEALTGTRVATYTGHAAEIQTLIWSPDSRFIASTDLQNKTMVWRVMM